MNYFSKLVFPVVFATAVAVGFASCSSDDDDNTDNGVKEGVILLPKRITCIEQEDATADVETSVYTFKYDKNNRLESYNSDGEDFDLKYDDKGRLVAFDDVYSYDYSKAGEVMFKTDGGQDDAIYILNDKGQMVQKKGKRGGESTFDDISNYTYDANNNVSVMTDSEYTEEFAYHKEFSPFKDFNLPAYFMLYDDNWSIQPTGKNMLKSGIRNSTNSVIEYKEHYEIVESKYNYPTKMKIVKEELNEDGKTYDKRTYIYTVEYNEVKVK